MRLFCWSLLVLFQQVGCQYSDDRCGVYYILQPPTHLTCNPYNADTGYGLRMECSAYGPQNVSFKLDWHMAVNATEYFINNAISNARISSSNTFVTGGQFVRSQLIISRLNSLTPGIFWCQIALTNSSIRLFPSQPLNLRDRDDYAARYPPCSRSDMSDAMTRCALTGRDLSAPGAVNDATSATPTEPTTSRATTEDDETAIPLWGYTVIAVGGFAALTIIVITGCIIYAMVQTRSKRNYRPEAFAREVQVVSDETRFQQVRRPLVPPKPTRGVRSDCSSLPPRLTVARQLSAAGEYVEVPRPGSLPLSRLVTVQATASRQTVEQTSSDHSLVPYTAYQEGASNMPSSSKGGKQYSIVDPNRRDPEAAEYTDPIATVKSKPDILQETTKELQFQLSTESDAYCNDDIVLYQSLSPQTKDYTHIYSHPE